MNKTENTTKNSLNERLVSIIILSYNNYRFIFDAIDSVLIQSYSNIELIISDDASNDFDRDSIIDHIEANRATNLKHYTITQNEINLGTVKNMNIALRLAQGEYIIPFAADDKIYHKDVIRKIVDAFKKLSENDYLLTTQVGMFDITLTHCFGLFLQPYYSNLLNVGTARQVYEQLASSIFIPSCGTCYKSRFFEKYGYFDESYFLVEDWSRYLQLTRNGISIRYFDFISFMHRDGGVSHGNKANDKKIHQLFYNDLVRICEKEILPFLDTFTEDRRLEAEKTYEGFKQRYMTAAKASSPSNVMVKSIAKLFLDLSQDSLSVIWIGLLLLIFDGVNGTFFNMRINFIDYIGATICIIGLLLALLKFLYNAFYTVRIWLRHFKFQNISSFLEHLFISGI